MDGIGFKLSASVYTGPFGRATLAHARTHGVQIRAGAFPLLGDML
jgi:hypothetical protein